MSQPQPSVDLAPEILRQIERGDLAAASNTLCKIEAQAHLPHVCNPELLTALQKARSLVIVQRSHLLMQLRSLDASRLYCTPAPITTQTWQLDG